MVRFIHAADLHVDRAFEGLANLNKKTHKIFAQINQQVLINLVTAAVSQNVDFVLLAGDTFHQNKPSLKTQHFFFEQIQRLAEKKIPVYMIFGNHDYYDPQRYWFAFPENIRLFTSEKVMTFEGKTKNGETYAISGFSYTHPWIETSKVSEFPKRRAVDLHIGMYHGDSNGERYAPFSISQMQEKNYDYWALGHIHVPTVLKEQPPILYSGTTQGHNKKETATGIQLVEYNGSRCVRQEIKVEELAWVHTELSLAKVRNQQEALEEISRYLEQQPENTLQSLQVTDSEHLGNEFLAEYQLQEVMDYVNERPLQKEKQIILYEITSRQTASEKLFLPASGELLQLLLTNYQDQALFEMIHEELLTHTIAAKALDKQQYQEDVLKAVRQFIDQGFEWEEDK